MQTGSVHHVPDELIGKSKYIQHLRERVRRIAACDVSVLIEGESGTGKEVIARIIHNTSRRRTAPFIGVNCAAINQTLLESELFGHEAGAYTGANNATLGFLRAADGGTILLDEIGDMSPPLQSALLRVLEERAVTPVGGTRAVPVDIRVIAATNRNLLKAVRAGTFREDLLYRLNVIRIQTEPLRQRSEDIPSLARYLLQHVAELLDMPPKQIAPDAMRQLMEYDWPGNIRQLSNVIQQAYVLGSEQVIEESDLPPELLHPVSPSCTGFPPLEEAVRSHVREALIRSNGARAQAARLLGIDRKSLWRMMRRYEFQ
jgi:transcriptional regulator with PAS, ATPase and Fis domain